MVQVSFRHPEETDLVFFYLQKQMETFDEEGIKRPDHKIVVGEGEIIVELDYPHQDEYHGPIGPNNG